MSAKTSPKSDGVWRVFRFEAAGGKYAEVASNQVGPEQIPVPPDYRFVSSTPMVLAVVTDEMVERGLRELYGDRYIDELKTDDDDDWWIEKQHEMRSILTAALTPEAQR